MYVKASTQALIITYGTFYECRYLFHFSAKEGTCLSDKYRVNCMKNKDCTLGKTYLVLQGRDLGKVASKRVPFAFSSSVSL